MEIEVRDALLMHYRSKLDQFNLWLHCNNPFASKFVVEVCVVPPNCEKKGMTSTKSSSVHCSVVCCLAYVIVFIGGVLCCMMDRYKFFDEELWCDLPCVGRR